MDVAFTKVHLTDAWASRREGSRLRRATARDRLTKPSVDCSGGSRFMYMRHAAHIRFASLREQSSTVLLISDLAPAAKGCFRFCTPGQQMLPKNLFMGEMHPQNASQLCSMRPTDGSKHGQGMLQVTVHLFLLFRTPPRVSWGRPKSERPCSQVSRSAFSEVPASNKSARRRARGTEKAERRRSAGRRV